MQDLLKLIEPKAPSPDSQLHLLEQEQEKSIRQLSQESTALRKRLTDLERRHQAIQDIFVGLFDECDGNEMLMENYRLEIRSLW